MKIINFKAFSLYCKAGANQCQKQNVAVQYTRSLDPKEYEQICHFRRLAKVELLQLTCSTEIDLLRRQPLLGLEFFVGFGGIFGFCGVFLLFGCFGIFFYSLNHSGNTYAMFLFGSYDDYALT